MVARADYEIKPFHTRTYDMAGEEWDWLEAFYDDLRPLDKRELKAAHGRVYTAILRSVISSEAAYSVTGANGEPLVLYGKCAEENLPGRLIWCMATNSMGPYEREFARVSKAILQEWAEKHGILWNAVGDFNEPAKRWLKWCGAEFGKPLEMGGEKFVRFYIRGK